MVTSTVCIKVEEICMANNHADFTMISRVFHVICSVTVTDCMKNCIIIFFLSKTIIPHKTIISFWHQIKKDKKHNPHASLLIYNALDFKSLKNIRKATKRQRFANFWKKTCLLKNQVSMPCQPAGLKIYATHFSAYKKLTLSKSGQLNVIVRNKIA